MKNKDFYAYTSPLIKFVYQTKCHTKTINNRVFEKSLSANEKNISIHEKSDEKPKLKGDEASRIKAKVGTKFNYWYNAGWKSETLTIGGKTYTYKSSWEIIYAKYLQALKSRGLIRDWQYEPDKFYFEKVKRGLKAYIPDFKVFMPDGNFYYCEVKGFLDSKAKTKLNRFAKFYPNLKLRVISKDFFGELKRKYPEFFA